MKIIETEATNFFVINLEDYYGSGYIYTVHEAIKNKIIPEKIEKNDLEVSWDYSEFEIIFTKNNIEVKVKVDDLGSITFILRDNIASENKQKLREWATIIAHEIKDSLK